MSNGLFNQRATGSTVSVASAVAATAAVEVRAPHDPSQETDANSVGQILDENRRLRRLLLEALLDAATLREALKRTK